MTEENIGKEPIKVLLEKLERLGLIRLGQAKHGREVVLSITPGWKDE